MCVLCCITIGDENKVFLCNNLDMMYFNSFGNFYSMEREDNYRISSSMKNALVNIPWFSHSYLIISNVYW